jgi:hypothetical protein
MREKEKKKRKINHHNPTIMPSWTNIAPTKKAQRYAPNTVLKGNV